MPPPPRALSGPRSLHTSHFPMPIPSDIAVESHAFDILGWDEVIHSISPENTASQTVAQRLGSRNRGPGKLPPPLDVHAIEIWAQSRAEWAENRKRFA